MTLEEAFAIIKPAQDKVLADYAALSPDQRRAAALAEIEEARAHDARAHLASVHLSAAMACARARLLGLPDPEESRRIITVLPVELPDA